ncbi:hypothetical protein V496_10463 [Pseudogymnoascus sp. VKM F-4515 (FW-2607)]|nr:hypothetical protein V496_10463 [Pseudogymnoascus sp. VKM F-4515 (FW-2607)]KFY86359.1 hypothetical protein V498_07552 [Pseudogymnoascus sp. VKM F-4517 (FW-2822)]
MSSPDLPGLPPTPNDSSRKHGRPDEDEQPQKLQRRRIACQRCRGRKVKCDNSRPSCGSCVESGRECVYFDSGREKSPEASIPPLLMNRLDQILAGVQDITASLRPQGNGHVNHMRDQVGESPRHSEISNVTPTFQQPATIDDAQKDYLRIPSTNTTADTILTWPIFAGEYPPEYLIEAILGKGEDDKSDAFTVRYGEFESLSDERIPSLIDRFLRNVHTKNPILDVDALLQYGQTAAARGPGWDAPSCLVLLACALGSVSFSFESSIAKQTEMSSAGLTRTSASTYKKELRQAESCYALACRRLGLLKHTILGAQCYFYSAVYLMYTFAPLQAWNHFCQASTFYQLSFRKISKMSETPRLDGLSLTHRRLEQSLYWSCFKSECEIRVELPLPQSGIASIEYPHLFPSPPSHSRNSSGRTLHGSEMLSTDPGSMHDSDKDQNEEKSWYYYLTEVALRRISNRILSTFYRQDHTNWNDILPLIPIAKEFESQILVWSANLPPAMQYDVNLTEEGPSRELSWATGNRLLEMRSWLYQPFLYHAIHTDTRAAHIRENPVLQSLVQAAMDCHLETVQKRSFRHRHHGIWFDIRAVVSAAFSVIAAAKSGRVKVGAEWGGHVTQIIATLAFWEGESPDLVRTRQVLERLFQEVGYFNSP